GCHPAPRPAPPESADIPVDREHSIAGLEPPAAECRRSPSVPPTKLSTIGNPTAARPHPHPCEEDRAQPGCEARGRCPEKNAAAALRDRLAAPAVFSGCILRTAGSGPLPGVDPNRRCARAMPEDGSESR